MLVTELMEQEINKSEPLASRMRPQTIDEIVGQKHLLGKGELLRTMIEKDIISSIILYGPPGCGKTTIAKVIAKTTRKHFVEINATTSGKKEMEDVIKEAEKVKMISGKKTVLFIDEIHRFSKSQQDYLLSFVEKGVIILIGATTELPYYEVNAPLLSRSTLFELKAVNKEDIIEVINRALADNIRGIRIPNIQIDEEAKEFIAEKANGDVRFALNVLELAVNAFLENKEGKDTVSLENVKKCVFGRNTRYDKKGMMHYDVISAFIKSMRASKPDDAMFYLTVMMDAGEDPLFIARRMVIFASEDVGPADVSSTTVAMNALNAVSQIGMPESKYILANAALHLAKAPKSREAADKLREAEEKLQREGITTVPVELTNHN